MVILGTNPTPSAKVFSGTKRPLFGQNERKQSTGVKFYVAAVFRTNPEYFIAATARIMLISIPCSLETA